jgi:protein-S-isoprenylcysteine O-methyltransferase Ste14
MKEKNGEHPLGDVGQLILLALFLIVWIADSFFLRTSTFLSDHIPLYVRLLFLGLALAIGAYLSMSGHDKICREQRGTKVVSSGAFRYVRHPLYSACLLFYLGLAVSTASIFSLAFFMVIFVFYNYLASYEERLLDEKFGEEYRRYRKRTGKWVPGIGKGSLWGCTRGTGRGQPPMGGIIEDE